MKECKLCFYIYLTKFSGWMDVFNCCFQYCLVQKTDTCREMLVLK